MTDKVTSYRCLAIVQLGNDSSMDRLAKDYPEIIDLFRNFSDGEMKQFFRSNDGVLFGYFLKTDKPHLFIKAEFEKSETTTNADKIILTEIREEFNGNGFNRTCTCLQVN